MIKRTRSFLKMVGGKYNALEQLLPSFSKAKRFIEPFAGSGTIFLNINYPSYVLAEINADLINLYQYIRDEGESFVDYCTSFFTIENNTQEYYLQARADFNKITNKRLHAALFLYLNRHGYRGLSRYSQKSGYNVPFVHNKTIYFPHKELQAFHHKSQQAEFLHADFRTTFALAEPDDLIYCDPPYAPIISQKSNFTSYMGVKFGAEEHIALAAYALNAARHGSTVLISNHDTDFTRKIYQKAEIQSFPVIRRIGVDKTQHHRTTELLAIFHATKS